MKVNIPYGVITVTLFDKPDISEDDLEKYFDLIRARIEMVCRDHRSIFTATITEA